MWATDPILAILITTIAAVLLALLLRSAGLSRAAIAGGILAGALAGPTVLGRAAPQQYERYFLGGAAQHEALRNMKREHGAAIAALRDADVSDAAIQERLARQKVELATATALHETAQRDHQSSRVFLMAVLALSLIVAAAPRSRRPASWSECTFAALWMLVLTCGIVGLAVVFAFEGSRIQAVALGLSFAAVGSNVVLPPNPSEGVQQQVVVAPREIRDRLVDVAFVVWFICFVAAVTAVIAAGRSTGGRSPDFTAALPTAVLLGVSARLLPLRLKHALRMIVVPAALTSLLVVTLDLFSATLIAPLVLAAIVGGDARWFGLASGMRWQGWPWRSAWMGTMPLVDAAPMQVAMAAAFFLSGWLNEPLLACAVFGAVICDITQPLRPRLLTMLSEPAEDQSHP